MFFTPTESNPFSIFGESEYYMQGHNLNTLCDVVIFTVASIFYWEILALIPKYLRLLLNKS